MSWLRNLFVPPEEALERQSEVSLDPFISAFWAETYGGSLTTSTLLFSPRLLENVWAANRCLQLNAQQVSSMPLRYRGAAFADSEGPAWLSSPDPVWFPNGIQDALFAATWHLYGWGDAFLLVTSRYTSGLPKTWTVLDPAAVGVDIKDGRRGYTINDGRLNPEDVVQISRDPRGGLRGTSALRSYATSAWNIVAGGQTTNNVLNNLPPAVLKSERKLTQEQAQKIQTQWSESAATRGSGVPPVLPPEISLDPTRLGFSPKDLLLLEAKEFDARVVASAFGVPASLLNMAVTGGLTYQNPAMLGEQWWRFELLPAAGRIAAALSARMLPRGNSVIFDASAIFSPLDEESEGQITDPPTEQASPSASAPNVQPLRPVGAMP